MIRRFFCVLRVIFSTSWTKLFCIRFCYDGVSERDVHKFIKEGRRRHKGSSSVSPYTGIHPSHLCVKFIATNVVHGWAMSLILSVWPRSRFQSIFFKDSGGDGCHSIINIKHYSKKTTSNKEVSPSLTASVEILLCFFNNTNSLTGLGEHTSTDETDRKTESVIQGPEVWHSGNRQGIGQESSPHSGAIHYGASQQRQCWSRYLL